MRRPTVVTAAAAAVEDAVGSITDGRRCLDPPGGVTEGRAGLRRGSTAGGVGAGPLPRGVTPLVAPGLAIPTGGAKTEARRGWPTEETLMEPRRAGFIPFRVSRYFFTCVNEPSVAGECCRGESWRRGRRRVRSRRGSRRHRVSRAAGRRELRGRARRGSCCLTRVRLTMSSASLAARTTATSQSTTAGSGSCSTSLSCLPPLPCRPPALGPVSPPTAGAPLPSAGGCLRREPRRRCLCGHSTPCRSGSDPPDSDSPLDPGVAAALRLSLRGSTGVGPRVFLRRRWRLRPPPRPRSPRRRGSRISASPGSSPAAALSRALPGSSLRDAFSLSVSDPDSESHSE